MKKDQGDEEPSKTPEPDLDNHYTEDSYPMQDSDIEELIESNSIYSTKYGFHLSYLQASCFILWLCSR